ncbi:DUF2279 domain-containing protein [Flavobacterium sp. SUN052]|uniref:DUF2279 domain-containing protein n=1 Tax=Flavobacterium sp. SUN052 TaxID=3002441 RepID=UPI00237E4927|nr:DUF2279 domain-containing protein [Flavobacterium sp. SUN052]MEC4005446.1 DUF2279 domain-containing protein [Flavobacterium sp. SUN052]
MTSLKYSIVLFLGLIASCFAQSQVNSFLKPSDTLNKPRLKGVVISETALASAALVGLSQLWYTDYPQSGFHTVDDSSEWLQMDKAGHLFSTYHLGSFGANALKWSGTSRKSQLLYGSTIGFAFMSVVEVFDGNSSQWGFSWSDMAANAAGTGLYVSQELLWKEQRIVPKFSFHTTEYAAMRPNVLGSSISQQILKDYNGQTYWLSANLHSFFKHSKIPKWMNIAVGYGADGMITGRSESTDVFLYPNTQRTRQFYLSLDADLTKINTKSHFLKTFFAVFNSIKIPAPTFEINGLGVVKFHYLYF